MIKLGDRLSSILRYVLIPFMLIIAFSAIRLCFVSFGTLLKSGYGLITLIAGIAALILGIAAINSKYDNRDKLCIIFIIAFILRVLWVWKVPSMPVSDYNTMYDCAARILEGDFSGMRGTGYFSRYPHLTVSVLYMAFMKLVFNGREIFIMKEVSLVLSMINVLLIYKISQYFVNDKKTRLYAVLFAAVFPPFITYVSTFCTENQAMPLLLAAVLYFCKIINGEVTKKNVILCGLFVGLGNLFRGVGTIFIIAMCISVVLKMKKHRIRVISGIIITTLAVTAFASTALLVTGITESHIWNGKESSITYFLKGLNVDAKGAWNETDAKFVEEHLLDENFDEQCIEIIKSRLSEKTPSELAKFFFDKFVNQWVYGDCNGSYWAFMNTNINYRYPIDIGSQILGTLMIVLSAISMFKKQNKQELLLHTLLCGFGLFFLIFESQPRYSYIISWVFVLMAAQGIEAIRLKGVKRIEKE